jgi:hypothetical protein
VRESLTGPPPKIHGTRDILVARAAHSLETACGTATPIVDVLWTTYNAVDVDDSGSRAWAYDRTNIRRIRIWQTASNSFCELDHAEGTFESIAGQSPAGGGTVSAGVQGRYFSIATLTYTGTFDPGSRPTDGVLESCDNACQIDLSDHTRWSCKGGAGTWFPGGRANQVYPASGLFLYDAGSHGRWLELGVRSIGDIVG